MVGLLVVVVLGVVVVVGEIGVVVEYFFWCVAIAFKNRSVSDGVIFLVGNDTRTGDAVVLTEMVLGEVTGGGGGGVVDVSF